jgi:hypothetical protein
MAWGVPFDPGTGSPTESSSEAVNTMGASGVASHATRASLPNSNPADRPLALQVTKRRQSLLDQLAAVAMFDVVALQDIDVIDAEPGSALVQTAQRGFTREIPGFVAVAANLGHQHEVGARYALQRGAEGRFGARQTVIGRHVDQIDPGVQRGLNHGVRLAL